MKIPNPIIDYYEILEVSPNANDEVIQKAYQAMLEKYQPEQYHSSVYKTFATKRTQLVHDAYRVLSDTTQRRRYDVKLAEKTRIPSNNSPSRWIRPTLRVLGIALFVFLILGFFGAILQAALTSPIFKLVMPLLLVFALFWFLKERVSKLTKR